jgi:pimeloyl-ACP methyl ester carboxylesterase
MLPGKVTSGDTIRVYLFPGQGADYRQFGKLVLPPEFDTICIHYPVPEKGMNMEDYARSLIDQIDTSEKYIFIGVSLGGMICSELTDILHPLKTILISSAKSRHELPSGYINMRWLPAYKLLPANVLKTGSFVVQPLFEPDRKKEKSTCVAMLKDKDPVFLKRSVSMIVNWDKETYNERIIHIHGSNDHTLPISNVRADHIIQNGSHMMVLTRPNEISELLTRILSH